MSASRPMPVRFYADVGNSFVLNYLGSLDVEVVTEPITDENRLPGDAVEATVRVVDFDLPSVLRTLADKIEEESRGSRPDPVL